MNWEWVNAKWETQFNYYVRLPIFISTWQQKTGVNNPNDWILNDIDPGDWKREGLYNQEWVNRSI